MVDVGRGAGTQLAEKVRAVRWTFAGLLLTSLHHVYELPNDVVFEVTGVLQVMPAAVTARSLYRMQARAGRGPSALHRPRTGEPRSGR